MLLSRPALMKIPWKHSRSTGIRPQKWRLHRNMLKLENWERQEKGLRTHLHLSFSYLTSFYCSHSALLSFRSANHLLAVSEWVSDVVRFSLFINANSNCLVGGCLGMSEECVRGVGKSKKNPKIWNFSENLKFFWKSEIFLKIRFFPKIWIFFWKSEIFPKIWKFSKNLIIFWKS